MKVAILECDEMLEKFQPQFGHYKDMIRHMFDHLDTPFEFEDFDCRLGCYPEDIHGYDFYITTGSKASVYIKTPWIQQLIKFVQHLDKHKKKLIGICFGHQAIAMACHGMVKQSDKGWGIGIAVNRIVTSPDWMRDKRKELNIIVSHQDQITSLPEEALVIAESDFCPFFMVQWNNHFLSIQGHPEFNSVYSRTVINHRRGILPAERIAEGLDSLDIAPDNRLFTRWIMDFVGH
jgi:GMP synthase-like glutamine amidotransferase